MPGSDQIIRYVLDRGFTVSNASDATGDVLPQLVHQEMKMILHVGVSRFREMARGARLTRSGLKNFCPQILLSEYSIRSSIGTMNRLGANPDVAFRLLPVKPVFDHQSVCSDDCVE
jgi:hypothetical protein